MQSCSFKTRYINMCISLWPPSLHPLLPFNGVGKSVCKALLQSEPSSHDRVPGRQPKFLMFYTRPAGRAVSVGRVPFSPLQVKES